MIWGGIQKTSTLDFPGILSCVLFTRGCDLDCFYCHNRSLIGGGSLALREDEILAFFEKGRNVLDGVVVSGGEPAIQPDLPAFLQKLRNMGYKIKLDTNGQNPDTVKKLLIDGLLDYVAVDIKALPRDYEDVCGVAGFENTAKTVQELSSLGADYEVRTTLYPSMNIEELKELLGSFPVQKVWRLNYFRMPEHFKDEDFKRLQQTVITPTIINENLSELKELQPNLSV